MFLYCTSISLLNFTILHVRLIRVLLKISQSVKYSYLLNALTYFYETDHSYYYHFHRTVYIFKVTGSKAYGRSFLYKKFVSEFGCPAAFSNAGGSQLTELSHVENDGRQISHFLTPVKITGGVGDYLCIPVVEAIPTTELPEYIRWPSTRLLSAVV